MTMKESQHPITTTTNFRSSLKQTNEIVEIKPQKRSFVSDLSKTMDFQKCGEIFVIIKGMP